jgi:hypothetical protein
MIIWPPHFVKFSSSSNQGIVGRIVKFQISEGRSLVEFVFRTGHTKEIWVENKMLVLQKDMNEEYKAMMSRIIQ